jgi:hypothetical protein
MVKGRGRFTWPVRVADGQDSAALEFEVIIEPTICAAKQRVAAL